MKDILEQIAWKTRAACRGVDPNLFFPPTNTNSKRPRKRDPFSQARLICSTCPVKQECLEEAVLFEDFHGMRAGLEPEELRRVTLRRTAARRDHAIAQHGHAYVH